MNVLDDSTEDIIYDPTTINWTSFDWSEGYSVHKITYNEIIKPYLISYTYFNTVDYEDILMFLNNIDDPWALVPGSELWIPTIGELKNFLSLNFKSG